LIKVTARDKCPVRNSIYYKSDKYKKEENNNLDYK